MSSKRTVIVTWCGKLLIFKKYGFEEAKHFKGLMSKWYREKVLDWEPENLSSRLTLLLSSHMTLQPFINCFLVFKIL